jgi:predicted aminopeptidase
LGWFDDSLLSTVLNRAEYQLAGLIFHELAHQLVYLPGDTTFNESFATAVEREGLRRWLLDNNQQDTIEIAEQNRIRQQQFVELVTDYRDRFDALYEEPLADDIMRLRKSELQQQMRTAYEAGKQRGDGYGGYDTWFANSLNNGQLSTVGSYNDLVPFFNSLLAEAGNDLPQFYEQVQLLAEMDEDTRDSRLGRDEAVDAE